MSLGCACAAHSPRPCPSVAGWWVLVTWVRLAFSSRLGTRRVTCFRSCGSEMTERGASPEDPWVKASLVGAHAGGGTASLARARRGSRR